MTRVRAGARWLASACLAYAAGCGNERGAPDDIGPVDAAPLEAGARPYGCTGALDAAGRPPICDVAHVAVRVTDLARARSFYGAYLGFEEPFGVSDRVAVFKINDSQFIELHQEAAPSPPDLNFQLKNIAFYTSDAEALRAYYASKNVAVAPAVTKNFLGNTSFTVVDQDAHVLEWVEYEPDSLTGQTQGLGMPPGRLGAALHHTGVTIADAARADAFYYALGLVPSSTADRQAPRAPEGMDRIEYGTYHTTPTKEFAVVRDHLCLRVPDIASALQTLASRDPSVPVEQHLLRDVTLRANVQDPDGSRIEMAESTPVAEGELAANGVVLHL
jgi:catechol 2,3-dioxygenase-like lactoylglutathione lyase family enzyme